MKFFYPPKTLVVAATICLYASTDSRAATNYGNFSGTTVTFENVTEWSPTGDPLPLYGAPVVIGNTLDFTPSFFSSATNGANDVTDGTLSFLLKAKPGNAITSVLFSERGDFTFTGIGGTINTYVSVTATFFIDIYKVDGVALMTPLQLTETATFTPSASGIFDKVAYPTPPNTRLWTGSLNLNVNNALTSALIPYINGATEISFELDNILVAQSETGTSATITKKDFKGFGVTVNEVPEPTSLALLFCGAGWLLIRRKAN
ncbi:MAG: PEP-CTERM sorting domain-containing protein [Verrucomicrobiota bacterium]